MYVKFGRHCRGKNIDIEDIQRIFINTNFHGYDIDGRNTLEDIPNIIPRSAKDFSDCQ